MKTISGIAGLGLLVLVNSAVAQVLQVISVDEWGTGIGTLGPGYFAPDTGPGASGQPVLTYDLPFTVVPGDVFLMEGGTGGDISDVLRFNPSVAGKPNTLVFYSDLDSVFEPADAPFPIANYPNPVSLPEVDPYVTYAPAIGGPGDGNRVEYHFYSDARVGDVPEGGATIILLLLGLSSLLGFKRK